MKKLRICEQTAKIKFTEMISATILKNIQTSKLAQMNSWTQISLRLIIIRNASTSLRVL